MITSKEDLNEGMNKLQEADDEDDDYNQGFKPCFSDLKREE